VIGILAIDTTEAGLGILTGDRWETVDTLTSGVSGKHRQGGQSARRFERLRENELNDYYHRVADHAKAVFIDQYPVKGLIVGGPGPTKENFLKEEYLDYRLQNNILATLDTSYSGNEGVREIIDKAQKDGILAEFRVMEEKQMVKKFMGEVHSGRGLGIYGIFDVIKMMQGGVADLVLVASDISYVKLDFTCKSCGNVQERIVDRSALVETKQDVTSKPCPKCKAADFEVVEKDVVDYMQELATMTGTRLEIISAQMEEGAQLVSLGRVGAILRYKPA
jgi:peptide chain release factor subunit 1